jgi:hypothetical protein
MSTIHNSDLFKEFKEGAKTQQLRDVIPTQMADKIVPVMEVNPKLLRRINFVKRAASVNATGVNIIPATPTEKDTFIVSASLAYIKDATATSLSSYIQAVLDDGSIIELLDLPQLTLTASSGEISVSFPNPIKLKKGSAITVQNNTANANISTQAIVYGYYVENPNA